MAWSSLATIGWFISVLLMIAVTNYAAFWPPLSLRKRILLLLVVMISDMAVAALLCVEAGHSLSFAGLVLIGIVVFIFSASIFYLQNERRRLETLRQNPPMKLEELKAQLVASRFYLPYVLIFGLITPASIVGAPELAIVLSWVIGIVVGHISSRYFLGRIYREWEERLAQAQREALAPFVEKIGIEPTYDALDVYVKQTFTKGMSRDEVLEKLGQLGTYRLYEYSAGFYVKGKRVERAVFQPDIYYGNRPAVAIVFIYSTTDESLLKASLKKPFVESFGKFVRGFQIFPRDTSGRG
jgi:hypothetical protein